MTKSTVLYLLLLVFPVLSYGWHTVQPADTTRVNQLIDNANTIGKENPEKAIAVLKQAFKLAEAQKNKIKQAHIHNHIGDYYRPLSKVDSSLYHHQLALQHLKPNEDATGAIHALHGIAKAYMQIRQTDSAHVYFDQAFALADEIADFESLASIHIGKGNNYLNEYNYTDALEQFIRSATLQDSLLYNPVELGRALGNIGNVQFLLDNYDKALDYASRSLGVALDNNQPDMAGYLYRLMGRIYRKMNQLDQALESYRLSIAQYQQINDHNNICETYISIGNIYHDKREHNRANTEYSRALAIAKSINNVSTMAYTYAALGYSHYELKRYTAAIAYSDSARMYATGINPYLVMDSYEIMSLSEAQGENYKAAFEYQRQYSTLKDSLNNAENRKVSEELASKYEHTVQRQEIELLKSEQLLKEEALEQERLKAAFTIVALLLVIIISVLLVNRYRLLNRARRQKEMEKMRLGIAQDLHDDVGSTLSGIQIISQMALKNDHNGQSKYFSKIAAQTGSIMEKLGDIVWSLKADDGSMEDLLMKMREFAGEILEPVGIDYDFDGEKILLTNKLPLEKRKNTFLIFKEAINNAAKYSQANTVNIRFAQQNDYVQMIIADNGNGFIIDEIKKGNGLNHIRQRAEKIDAKAKISSKKNGGTKISVEIPLT